ncbi:ferritin [Wenyingzhuangia sp. 2_MG-2023]|uniref:ferritin n=1 Tax=Wenyingzhuangia sp. 2_MG-2023 TaxID=3062639 RepID=UPI0026E1847F|nr:ferritin [Wenyingzhuangia sp. 2_MG-2023]MDO6738136.1 ferritin [Wenyingzhuangia sp. 2_MG-2023]MDO6801540.1 ferritin [Wenyingzhuangia sp. 1_MG-2023]
MNTAIRTQMSIHTEVMDLLNNQIAMEMHASASYLAMASWCDQRELLNSKALFYEQAEEEREHAMKIFKFINDNGGSAISPTVVNVNNEFESLLAIYEKSLEQEIAVSDSIKKIFKKARTENDFVTEIMLQWFITEQAEEEDKFRSIIDLFDLMEGMPLKMIDERISKD